MDKKAKDKLEEGFKRFDKALFEYKYDGARLSIHKDDKVVNIFTREAEEVSQSLPEIVEETRITLLRHGTGTGISHP